MKQITTSGIIALAISFFIIACNNEDKKAEPSSGDSTVPMNTDTTSMSSNQEIDAVKAAPALYKVLKDSMGIRMLEIAYKPGDSSAMHSHPASALYVLEGGKAEFTDKDGTKSVVDLKSGMASISGPGTHTVKNVGNNTFKAILVETTRPNTTGAFDKAQDASKVAPKFYKVVADSLNMRILMVHYRPGETSVLHSHPDLAMYLLASAKAEFTEKDGAKRVMTLDKGTAVIVPADTHSVKNVGNSEIRVVLVEVNRPAQ